MSLIVLLMLIKTVLKSFCLLKVMKKALLLLKDAVASIETPIHNLKLLPPIQTRTLRPRRDFRDRFVNPPGI